MKERKIIETFIYNGLGFPIKLINTPLKKVFGEWVLDINLNQFQIAALRMLIQKATPLTGAELNFIRSFFELSIHAFAKIFGVTHVAVIKWENEETRMNPSTEVCIRLYVLNRLQVKDKEFRKTYSLISIKLLSEKKEDNDSLMMEIDAEKQHLIA